MAKPRFELNRAGLGEFLTSAPVAAYLAEQGDSVVGAGRGFLVAEAGVSRGGGSVPARARVRVGYPSSMPAYKALGLEAHRGILANALAGATGLVAYTSKSGRKSFITQKQAENYGGRYS